MERLTHRDYRRLFEVLNEMYALRDHETFTSHFVDTLARLVPVDLVSYDEMNARTRRAYFKTAPRNSSPSKDAVEMFGQYMHQHPCVAYARKTGDGSPSKISDFLSVNQWKRLALYNEFYKPLGMVHNLGMQLSMADEGATMISMGLLRSERDFNERDRAFWALMRPHVARALENAQIVTRMRHDLVMWQSTIEQIDQPIVCVNAKGHILWATQRAQRLLGAKAKLAQAGRLPAILYDWINEQKRRFSTPSELPRPLEPLTFELFERRLRARLVADGDRHLVFLEEQRPELSPGLLSHLGLSRRETEILTWVAQGKSNPEIAAILGISVRTVHKHVERMYVKLGVENRHAAMRMVFDVASRQECSSRNDF
jgi:DNA-binding CsgD family transcriptional regulator